MVAASRYQYESLSFGSLFPSQQGHKGKRVRLRDATPSIDATSSNRDEIGEKKQSITFQVKTGDE